MVRALPEAAVRARVEAGMVRALPEAAVRARVEVGMVRALPEAAVRASPPAVEKVAAVIGSIKKIGCAEADTRQTARVKAIKPITFMVKLLIFCFCGRRKRTTRR